MAKNSCFSCGHINSAYSDPWLCDQPILVTNGISLKRLKRVVLKGNSKYNGLYKVDFSSADLHMLLRGTIVIFNINLKPDTAKLLQLTKETTYLAPK